NLARDRGEWLRAIACYRAALGINKDFDFCRRDLCVALAQSGQIREAHKVMAEGPAFDQNTATHHFFKGNLHFVADELDDAIACFQKATLLSPQDPLILLNLCAAQSKRSDFFAALESCRSVLSLDPNNAAAYGHMAIAHQFMGQHALTIDNYRNALRLNPENLQVHQNLLLALTYVPRFPREAYLLEAEQYAAKARARATPYATWLCNAYAPGTRPLRVGFVSADLMVHPVGMFLENVLPFLDSDKVVCIAYSNCVSEDAFTAHLKPMFAEWAQVAWMSDAELARKIHGDRIDILVDLSGHTGQSRLAVFAWRPAPTQVAWLGYWASTGMQEMDYLLVDPSSVRPEEAEFYSEKPWYVPDTRLCFGSPVTVSPITVGDLPALRKGYVTFASFQTLSKLTDETIAVWSQILAKLPSARLRIQSRALSYPQSLAGMRNRLASAHLDLDRIQLFGVTSRDGYLAAYGEVDVVLDTFPFSGGTTTAEALWMGVPTVTFTGSTLVSRQGESMLRCAGLEDWVARTEQEYIQVAVGRASDLPRLARLRAGLRETALASPLFDGARFAKNLESAFEGMATQTAATNTRE
ncbi:MAG: hypothetical protein H7293_21465, partial [Candidatus Saccharibacteria bacterium]|nr:hypothetical protein [Rhodoferax sp.]